ncbi:MAG TPA: TetR/AcrR family transcriptional regulator [Mollicutes bacterium]|nr:TetR/AcrR family transcriptional regulator [Mollicutes bacterium]
MSPKVNDNYKINKKQEILKAARKVFIKKGYIQATMQDIINEAGISRGALYSYFNNVEHVFEELLKLDDEKDITFIKIADDYTSFWKQLVDWIRLQKHIISSNNEFLLSKIEFFLIKHRESNKSSSSYITERYKNLITAITDFIDKGTEKKQFHPCKSSEFIALYMISFFDGLTIDTFNLNLELTRVNEQIDILIFTLENMLRPIK